MPAYWCTFRLAADKAYRTRYEALLKAIFAVRSRKGALWSEPSYFCAFDSELGLADLAAKLGETIDPARDFVVLGIIGTGEAIRQGSLQHPDAFATLFPEAARPS